MGKFDGRMSETIPVPNDSAVAFQVVNIPSETLAGILDAAAIEVRFADRRFQLLPPEAIPQCEALDVDSGEIVVLDFEGGPLPHG